MDLYSFPAEKDTRMCVLWGVLSITEDTYLLFVNSKYGGMTSAHMKTRKLNMMT